MNAEENRKCPGGSEGRRNDSLVNGMPSFGNSNLPRYNAEYKISLTLK